MCKTCVLDAHTPGLTLCTNNSFYTVFFKVFYRLRINPLCAQLFTTARRMVMNIKISLNSSINAGLSTVSTAPITKAVGLNFNETIII